MLYLKECHSTKEDYIFSEWFRTFMGYVWNFKEIGLTIPIPLNEY